MIVRIRIGKSDMRAALDKFFVGGNCETDSTKHLKSIDPKWEPAQSQEDIDGGLTELLHSETLGYRLARSVGHGRGGCLFTDVAEIAAAGRAHVSAIRTVQSVLDEVGGVYCPTVIIEKCWRVYPFQISIEGGGDVLALLAEISRTREFASPSFRAQLHLKEMKLHCLLHAADRSRQKPHHETAKKRVDTEDIRLEGPILEEDNCLRQMKLLLLREIDRFVGSRYPALSALTKRSLDLERALFVLLTSTIETLNAECSLP